MRAQLAEMQKLLDRHNQSHDLQKSQEMQEDEENPPATIATSPAKHQVPPSPSPRVAFAEGHTTPSRNTQSLNTDGFTDSGVVGSTGIT